MYYFPFGQFFQGKKSEELFICGGIKPSNHTSIELIFYPIRFENGYVYIHKNSESIRSVPILDPLGLKTLDCVDSDPWENPNKILKLIESQDEVEFDIMHTELKNPLKYFEIEDVPEQSLSLAQTILVVVFNEYVRNYMKRRHITKLEDILGQYQANAIKKPLLQSLLDEYVQFPVEIEKLDIDDDMVIVRFSYKDTYTSSEELNMTITHEFGDINSMTSKTVKTVRTA